MQARFYIESLNTNFYRRGKTHRERCAAIIDPLGNRLREIFPGNGLRLTTAYAYSLPEVYNADAQTMWPIVESMAAMLEAFSSPIGSAKKDGRYRRIPGLTDRSYWQGSYSDTCVNLTAP